MSRTILHIDSSARHEGSTSRELGRRFIAQWKRLNPNDRVVERDLATAPLPHLDETLLAAWFAPAESHTPEMVEAAARADALIEELFAADVVVIGAPMYNFGIPSTLKAYIDHIAQAGRTFRYGEQGPEGLVTGRPLYLLSARGGVYDDSPMDHQVAYLRTLFGFLGFQQIHEVQAQGLAMGDIGAEQAMSTADATIERLIPTQAAA